MYLHIGKNIIINKKNILGIFKVSTIENTKEYKEMEKNLKYNNRLHDDKTQINKSFILTDDKGYISNISVETLEKRAKSNII